MSRHTATSRRWRPSGLVLCSAELWSWLELPSLVKWCGWRNSGGTTSAHRNNLLLQSHTLLKLGMSL